MGKRKLGHIGELHAEGKLLDVLSLLKKKRLFLDASDMDEPYLIVAYDNYTITYQSAMNLKHHTIHFDYFLTARRFFISTAGNIISMFEDEQ